MTFVGRLDELDDVRCHVGDKVVFSGGGLSCAVCLCGMSCGIEGGVQWWKIDVFTVQWWEVEPYGRPVGSVFCVDRCFTLWGGAGGLSRARVGL